MVLFIIWRRILIAVLFLVAAFQVIITLRRTGRFVWISVRRQFFIKQRRYILPSFFAQVSHLCKRDIRQSIEVTEAYLCSQVGYLILDIANRYSVLELS